MVNPVCCQACGKELHEGDFVVRLQYGKIGYCKHVRVTRKASTDDCFCKDCVKSGNVAVRAGADEK